MTTVAPPPQPRPIELLGSFESTYQPNHDVDVAESTGHTAQWRADLALIELSGIRRLRYPIRWHRVEREDGRFDWRAHDQVLEHMRARGLTPIVDLVHHTSYPRWLARGFADPRFPAALLRYARAFAERYPWVQEYTVFNEPFSTLFLCGHEAVWPPYDRGVGSFVQLLGNALPAIGQASRILREMLPDARHVYVDSCEQASGEGLEGSRYACYANDRRFFVLDALLGRIDHAASRPFVDDVVAHGGKALLELEPATIDVLGLDYYAHCQWHFGERGEVPSPCPASLASLIELYAGRYGVPCMLGETNIRGFPSDRVSWFKYTLEQCERAAASGVPFDGYCWFPFVDSCDWDSLLYHAEGNVDPVGVFSLDDARGRRASSMSVAYARAARGATSRDLPAYRFREPVRTWLRGYEPQLEHWEWHEPPEDEQIAVDTPGDADYEPLRIRDSAA